MSRLSENTKVDELAETIVAKCKLIHPQKIPELEQLLAFLQKRMESKEFRKQQAEAAKIKKRSLMDHAQTEEQASIAEMDEYVSLLYEDTKEKIRGTALILQVPNTLRARIAGRDRVCSRWRRGCLPGCVLIPGRPWLPQVAHNPDNLEELVQNEPLMGAMARLFREEVSNITELDVVELCTNIIHIFFFLSSYTVFHDFLRQYQVLSLQMGLFNPFIAVALHVSSTQNRLHTTLMTRCCFLIARSVPSVSNWSRKK